MLAQMANNNALQRLFPPLESFSGLRRDLDFLGCAYRILKLTGSISPDSAQLAADDFEDSVDKYSENVAFRFEGELTTYAEFDARANQVAHWALAEGLKVGDVVALFMENRPDYVAVWVGLAKVGVITALVNHNLEGEALGHCINIAKARYVITGAAQDAAMESAQHLLDGAPSVWTLGGSFGNDLLTDLVNLPTARPSREHREALLGKDIGLYIYTSGTTGLPKAARITNARLQIMMRTFIAPCNTTQTDRVYNTLPLYHSTGGVCAVGQALMSGGSVILRRKFSASAFWDDVVEYSATSIVYIGELCRYLLNQPVHPKERAHQIRTGFGNGLRPEIWNEFRERFNIPELCEFYAATEGNVNLLSFDGTVGAVGRIPKWLEWKFDHVAFVKFDVETEKPVRGDDGFVVKADVNEVGEVLGRIGEKQDRFEGYNDNEATEKKILRDVFEPGDKWFRTGDLMRKDAQGYVYFVDRTGDTFRWKGENVSTNEVSQAFSPVDGVSTANVYGVTIPGTDGKAGMAAITLKGAVDFENLYDALSATLPSYAIPLFVRVQEEAETTGTFKYRKVELVKEGFDPDQVNDPIWMYHPDERKYVPLSQAYYEKLLSGSFRF